MAFLLINEGNFDGFNVYNRPAVSLEKAPGEDAPDSIKTYLYLQGNLLMYTRNGTFLGGTNLFRQSSGLLSSSELEFRNSLD